MESNSSLITNAYKVQHTKLYEKVMKNNRQNNIIKNIVVKHKPFAINIGDIVHTADMFGGLTGVVIEGINAPCMIQRFKVKVIAAEWEFMVGRERELFPGDLGMPGHSYDDRPCSLFRSRQAAKVADGRYTDWLTKHQAKRAIKSVPSYYW